MNNDQWKEQVRREFISDFQLSKIEIDDLARAESGGRTELHETINFAKFEAYLARAEKDKAEIERLRKRGLNEAMGDFKAIYEDEIKTLRRLIREARPWVKSDYDHFIGPRSSLKPKMEKWLEETKGVIGEQ